MTFSFVLTSSLPKLPKKNFNKERVFVWVTCDLTNVTLNASDISVHWCKHRLLEISVFLRNLVKSRRHILITLTSRTKEAGWMWWWRWNNTTLFQASPKLLFQSSKSGLRPHSNNHCGSPHRKHKERAQLSFEITIKLVFVEEICI